MLVDLHMHSRYSDGARWPAELAKEAAKSGLRGAALTDHDTLGGSAEFRSAAETEGLRCWMGVEIDCSIPELDYRSEILAYFPHGVPSATQAFLASIVRQRRTRTRGHIAEASRVFGRSDLSFEELEGDKLERDGERIDAASVSLSRVDLYSYLVRKGAVPRNSGYRDFRKAFFDSGILKDSKYRKPRLAELMRPIIADGGLAVIPHPAHRYEDDPERMEARRTDFEKLLRHCMAAGVKGIELYAYAPEVREALNRLVRRIAAPMGFFFTFGSDCHGPGSGRERLGDFSGDFSDFPQPYARSPVGGL